MTIPKHLTTCRAVFQGGGVKALALIGAVQEAYREGMLFSAVSGTSAGSVLAALLGAGADPRDLDGILEGADLSNLHKGPVRIGWDRSKLAGVLSPFIRNDILKTLAKFLSHGGRHSSSGIEGWLDQELSNLLPDAQQPVRFRDLTKPTYIIASDLTRGSPKIWSTSHTPDDSVAFAVRCSCAIPFFYQPGYSGHSVFVDGGLLSNLPLFVFSNSESLSDDPVVAFSLRQQNPLAAPLSPKEYVDRLYTSLVEGAKNIQNQLSLPFYSIDIDVTGESATDFKLLSDDLRRDSLIKKGRSAFSAFLDDHHSNRPSSGSNRRAPGFVADESEAFSWLVNEANKEATEVIFASESTRWFWSLFPTVLHLVKSGVSIRALTTNPQGFEKKRAQEIQRREMMSSIGIQVDAKESLNFEGYYLRSTSGNFDRALLCEPSSEEGGFGRCYHGPVDSPVLQHVWNSIESFPPRESTQQLSITSWDADCFIRRIKSGVPQYSTVDCSIRVEHIEVSRLRVLNTYLRASKYKQIEYLYRAFDREGLELFEPAMLMCGDEPVSPFTPPVVEKHGKEYVVIEGNTRVYYAWKHGIDYLTVFLVEGVTESLPGTPGSPKLCIVDSKKRQGRERIRGFDYDRFRFIERAMRPTGNNGV